MVTSLVAGKTCRPYIYQPFRCQPPRREKPRVRYCDVVVVVGVVVVFVVGVVVGVVVVVFVGVVVVGAVG